MPLAAFVLLTAANAFFVTAEFSLVTVDRAAIETQAQAGDRRARQLRRSLRELSFQLSGAQLGITIAALLTGYLTETLAHELRLNYAVVLASATLVSMLFGELVPKNAALARPMPLARATAVPMRVFSSILGWLIRALNGSANRVVRGLGVEPQEELASARSPEELGLLAAISARAGELPEDTARMLQRTIRFGDKRAAEAMTPRVDMVALPVTATLDELVAAALDSGHSRFPVYESTVDIVTGVVSVIDALAVPAPRRPAETVAGIAREPVYVPESLDLDGVLEALQAAGAEMAIVVDEYGGTDGVVTVEDLAEELVGEIADEYDVEPAAYEVTVPLTAMPSTLLVDGVVREDELAESTGFRLTEGPYETLAGFIMARLGHIPVEGETVEEHGWKFTVVEVQRRRIEKVRVTRPEEPDG
ncbi:MAG: HlyC/CorC family transporter [Actinobacteria bacterium]|nr:MAG: HlyC/CorC family transporter [Actinomycetota bacterium]